MNRKRILPDPNQQSKPARLKDGLEAAEIVLIDAGIAIEKSALVAALREKEAPPRLKHLEAALAQLFNELQRQHLAAFGSITHRISAAAEERKLAPQVEETEAAHDEDLLWSATEAICRDTSERRWPLCAAKLTEAS